MKFRFYFFNKYVIGIIILLFINLSLSSCYSIRETTLEDDKSIKISKIISFENDTIDFKYNQKGFATLTDDSVVSINKNGSIKTFPKSAVKTYYSEKFDTGKTVWTVLGVAVAVVVVFIGLIALGMDGRGFGG